MQTCILYAVAFIKNISSHLLIYVFPYYCEYRGRHIEFFLHEYSIILCVLLYRQMLIKLSVGWVLLAVCRASLVRFLFAAAVRQPSCQVNTECGHIHLLHHFFLSAIQPKSLQLQNTLFLWLNQYKLFGLCVRQLFQFYCYLCFALSSVGGAELHCKKGPLCLLYIPGMRSF